MEHKYMLQECFDIARYPQHHNSLPYLGSTPSKRLGLGQFVHLSGRCREVHSGLLIDLGAQCDISCGLKCLLRRKSGGNCVRPRRWRERNSGRRENGRGKKAELGHLHSDASEVNLFEFYCFSVDMWIWQRLFHQQCWTLDLLSGNKASGVFAECVRPLTSLSVFPGLFPPYHCSISYRIVLATTATSTELSHQRSTVSRRSLAYS